MSNLFEQAAGIVDNKPEASYGTIKGTIVDRSVGIKISLGKLGIQRKVASDDVQATGPVQPKEGILRARKKILESETLEQISELDSEIRDYIRRKTVPGLSLLGEGVYLIPSVGVKEVTAQLKDYRGRRRALVERFMVEEYDDCVRRAPELLGSLYNAKDYKSRDKAESAFSMDCLFVGFETPDNLKAVDMQLYIEAERDQAIRIEAAANEIIAGMRAEAADLVSKMVDRLTAAPGEKPKTFRDSLVGNVKEWLATFGDRNSITADYGLAELAGKMNQLLDGVDPQLLRDNDKAREEVAKGFAQIKETLDSMIVTRPTRRIKLDD